MGCVCLVKVRRLVTVGLVGLSFVGVQVVAGVEIGLGDAVKDAEMAGGFGRGEEMAGDFVRGEEMPEAETGLDGLIEVLVLLSIRRIGHGFGGRVSNACLVDLEELAED